MHFAADGKSTLGQSILCSINGMLVQYSTQLCSCSESVFVHFELNNPLEIPITIHDLTLDVEAESGQKDASYTANPIKDITLKPHETKKVCFGLVVAFR